MPGKGKRWILVKHFDGFPKESDMRLEEFDIPELKEEEVLLEAEYLSVDPYMRPYSVSLQTETVMIGQQVAKVIESRNDNFPVGTWTLPSSGWTTHTVSDGKGLIKMPLPEGVPRSYAIGSIGMPGVTAYFGLLDICTPKAGETVLVSAAAGAVGNVVGQIAKMKGCRVIGSAGSEEKLEHLKELGFDEVFNYKTTQNLDAKLKELAPDGIDVYFDNVGGEFATTAVLNMKLFGRIACCGAISGYNLKEPEKLSSIYVQMVLKQLKMEGFIIYRYQPRWAEAIGALTEWVKEGKIKVREHKTDGFENMFKAFTELFTGANTGKAVVKV
ncbi:prostaglandin reductase 1 [Strongylocentrotus purpuratus]|uniref:Prostaglandin reductase 1 n=1 Tax=Strongylocentrotus purpuratus TaxID=7668 RepID=A0A7M7HIT3_STRPU|nr:prostaglandin reductase 1 [Strongylocentrotus purpuratus]|eukprot:XP_011671731.1 PREDICTED: prostaglandin reductase 1 isoform X2 [Strongylocentrotus purpuratus]